jgi:hypothetical protein
MPTNKCISCGQRKPEDAVRCPSCKHVDEEVMKAIVAGTPGLTLLLLGLLVLWIYRFWILGWAALPGNFRIAALIAVGLGVAGIIFGPMWTLGVRSRKKAVIFFVIGIVTFLFSNFL